MKTIFSIMLAIGFMVSAFAQSIDKEVVATAGNNTSNATHQLTSTVGEPIIGLKSTTVSIDQGFLAGVTGSGTLSIDELTLDQTVKIYPNPITDLVHINIANNTENVTTTIYDIIGKKVAVHTMTSETLTLNLNYLESGTYLMQLHFKDTNTSKSFKIIRK
jgi:hypothetical protein